MKQIAVISGKGGTGKTSLTGCFSALAEGEAVSVDCDVDAANLYLILDASIDEEHDFIGAGQVVIDQDLCTGCGECVRVCRFDALAMNGEQPEVNRFLCESCAVCKHICPVKAIDLVPGVAGHWYTADTRFGPFVYAELYGGEENSGKLVMEIRKRAQEIGEEKNLDLCIIDGPPGTGCPVMSSVTGADYAVLVTEPTVSGLHDLKRALSLIEHFSMKAGVIINKSTVNPDYVREIENVCRERNIEILGSLPYHRDMIAAHRAGLPYVLYKKDDEISCTIGLIWEKIHSCVTQEE